MDRPQSRPRIGIKLGKHIELRCFTRFFKGLQLHIVGLRGTPETGEDECGTDIVQDLNNNFDQRGKMPCARGKIGLGGVIGDVFLARDLFTLQFQLPQDRQGSPIVGIGLEGFRICRAFKPLRTAEKTPVVDDVLTWVSAFDIV